MNPLHSEPSSFRDPSGTIFYKDGIAYRQVNKVFRDDFEHFISSGCYQYLVEKGWLLQHEVVNENMTGTLEWFTTLKPEQLRFISYPYEWTFDMLKDAALLTLSIAKACIEKGCILKDATPYNVQWHQGRMKFIDTLSFERYDETKPWIAYRQFCENFLAPLLLMHYKKFPLHALSLAYPEGIPLALARKLLPGSTRFSLHTYLHIHLNAKYAGHASQKEKAAVFSKQKLMNLLASLEILVNKAKAPATDTVWSDYYNEAQQRDNYLARKKEIIKSWLNDLHEIRFAADLGANDGEFAGMLSARNIFTLAADLDPACISRCYLAGRNGKEPFLHPLLLDLANPSPAIGFNNEERPSFVNRCHADLVMALAVIHHLAIGKNVPLPMIADFFSRVTKRYLLIEFVPKTDPKVQMMLSGKKDIYNHYSQEQFEGAFGRYFTVEKKEVIGDSGRTLHLMTRK